MPAPAYLKTGTEPKSRLAANDTASAKSTIRPSMPISWRRGRPVGAMATRARNAPYASPRPNMPPNPAKIKLSASNSEAMRLRVAPRAARMTNSCWRPSALTKRRLATLAQAISSTNPMPPNTTHKTLSTLPTTSCFNGSRLGPSRRFSKSLTADAWWRWEASKHDRDHPSHVRVGLRQRDPGLEPGYRAKVVASQVGLRAI